MVFHKKRKFTLGIVSSEVVTVTLIFFSFIENTLYKFNNKYIEVQLFINHNMFLYLWNMKS